MKKIILIAFLFSLLKTLSAQTEDSSRAAVVSEQHEHATPPLSITGYVDAYYAYYTDSVITDPIRQGNFQKFPTTSPRSNSLGLNLAMLTARYTTEKVRATVSLHYGDIVKSSWDTKNQFIQEAHIGVRLHKTLWLDAGFFRTHVGTEGLYAKENITSSVAVGTFNEPYYEAGARLNYSPTDKLAFSFYLLNGYNIYEDNNNKKSFGMLATYAFTDNFNIGYSNYIGDDSPIGDTLTHTRVYQNFFLNYSKNKIKIQMGGDYGMQQNSDTTGKKNATMFSALTTLRYAVASKFGIYTRGEIFNDPTGFLAGRFTDNAGRQTGYKLWGATLGLEYKPSDNLYVRLEGRQLQCDKSQQIFRTNGWNTNIRQEVMLHTGFYF